MLETTLQFDDGFCITLHRATVKQRIVRGVVYRKLRDVHARATGLKEGETLDDLATETLWQYAELIAGVSAWDGKAAWFASPSADGDTLYAAHNAFLAMDGALFDRVSVALRDVNASAVTDEKKA